MARGEVLVTQLGRGGGFTTVISYCVLLGQI